MKFVKRRETPIIVAEQPACPRHEKWRKVGYTTEQPDTGDVNSGKICFHLSEMEKGCAEKEISKIYEFYP